ncbi:MAG: diguanylate cyclase [Alteromonadaceae bacterium TMED7]|nr:MAG: diguanylate cyclase [Alteromonadaceae bacterium TMED7]|tara:strand:+ start:11421 stop:11609 length:189 start_codon:yes stop_codon:yes gene_type:complete
MILKPLITNSVTGWMAACLLNLSVSIGWAVYSDNAHTLNELLDKADAHMYKNKNAYYMGAHI